MQSGILSVQTITAQIVIMRKLTKEERAGLKYWATKYVANGAYCLKHGINVGWPMPG